MKFLDDKCYSATSMTDQYYKKIQKVLIITLFLNLVVCLAKIIYGALTRSLSLEADGFHSMMDSSSNVVGLVAIYMASKPPDQGHPYGHRKIEAIASLFISFLLFITCYEIITGVISRFGDDGVPEIQLMNFVIMVVTIAINIFVSEYEKRRGIALKSEILLADAVHTRSDIYVSLSVIVSFIAVLLKFPWMDIIIASGIVVFIIYVAFQVVLKSLNALLDAEQIDPNLVSEVVSNIEGISDCHHIRSRGTQAGVFVDMHIHVDPLLTTEESHKLTHLAIKAIKESFPQVIDVIVHTEPTHSIHGEAVED